MTKRPKKPSVTRRHNLNPSVPAETDAEALTALWIDCHVADDVFAVLNRTGVGRVAKIIAEREGGKDGKAEPNEYWRPVVIAILLEVVMNLDAQGKNGAMCTVAIAHVWLTQLTAQFPDISQNDMALVTAALTCVCIGTLSEMGCPLAVDEQAGPIVGRARSTRMIRL